VRIGDPVAVGQPLVRVFAHEAGLGLVRDAVRHAIVVGATRPTPPPLVAGRIA
jgi:thymidine phosphorylase